MDKELDLLILQVEKLEKEIKHTIEKLNMTVYWGRSYILKSKPKYRIRKLKIKKDITEYTFPPDIKTVVDVRGTLTFMTTYMYETSLQLFDISSVKNNTIYLSQELLTRYNVKEAEVIYIPWTGQKTK